jgi:hypothetical protein
MTRFVGLMLLSSLVACSSSTGPSDLSFEGKSTVSPTAPIDVQTVVTVRNTGDKTTQIATNICGSPIRAFTTAERDGAWVWQSYDPAAILCMESLNYATLAPGDYYDFHWTGTIPASLPSGVYYLAVNVEGKLVPAGQFLKQ